MCAQAMGACAAIVRRRFSLVSASEKQDEMFAPRLRALEVTVDLPCQKPEDARRQNLAVGKRPARITQDRQNAGETQPICCFVLPHDQVEVGSLQCVVFGDFPVVTGDGRHLLPPCLAQ